MAAMMGMGAQAAPADDGPTYTAEPAYGPPETPYEDEPPSAEPGLAD